MISIDYLSEENKLFINFYKEKLKNKKIAFESIINLFKNIDNLGCILSIDGIDYKLEEVVDNIKPDFFNIYYGEYREYKLLKIIPIKVQEMSMLIAVIYNFNSILDIAKYVDTFTEGEIEVVLFDCKLNNFDNAKDLKNIKVDNKFISLKIHSDAEVFEINDYRSREYIKCISNIIKNKFGI